MAPWRLLAPLVLALALGGPVPAQEAPASEVVPATLVADAIDFDDERLVASGGVEVFADGRVLRTERLTYLRDEDRLLVEGPLVLLEGADRIVVADFASLGAELRASVLLGARIVLNRKLQVAAEEIATGPEGRFTRMSDTVASSCEVCAAYPVPLWQIRAERVLHDREAQQLYFRNARFEVLGLPVFWSPYLRLPGPGLERSTGVLAPLFRSDDLLGSGVVVPVFIALGPSRDLTLTPFVSTTETRQLGFRYRQAFNSGAIEVTGAVAKDEVRPGETRGFLFAQGGFRLPRDYRLAFDIEYASDDDYLSDYDITNKKRLDSRIALSRVERSNRFLAEATLIRSQRASEDNDLIPTRIFTIERQGVTRPPLLGGQMTWTLQGHGRERTASVPPPGAPPESARDVLRASASADWQRSVVSETGLVTTAMAGLHLDAYDIRQDPRFPDDVLRAVPYAGLQLRLPLLREAEAGVRHVLEPSVQLLLAPDSRDAPPDEDSQTPEFDGGNLFSPQRFAGRDRRELGDRLTFGLSYDRVADEGWQVGGTVGRIFRAEDVAQFSPGTGLDGEASDWLLEGSARFEDRFSVLHRSLLDDSLELNRSETILEWRGAGRRALETRHTWLERDRLAGRPRDTAEWGLDARFGIGRDWTGRTTWRYDLVTDDPSNAGVGLSYLGNCVRVDFDVERRFTTSTPTTTFGLGVKLIGVGADDLDETRRGRCGI
jgi:LPS-assembly protein